MIIFLSGLSLMVLIAVLIVTGSAIAALAVVLAGLWFTAVLWFFRDPPRRAPDGDRLILSPADGRIIAVGVPDGGPLGSRGKRVSIFMSPLDVHVNRAPVAGVVRRVEHRSGRFFSAFKPRAERENERTIVILDSPYGRTALSQVAGFLARRIVFHPREGDRLVSGQRIGMIRFGSRVDLFLPDNVTLDARLGRRTVAGETILGVFNDD